MKTAAQTVSGLVDGNRVHTDYYTSEDVFELEIEQIFHKYWVYVGHASEVAQPGDYCVRHIGRQPVIMARGDDDRINVMLNRCRHRGAVVCHRESGNANSFRCAFHGWTYRNDGELVGVPFPKGYGENFDKSELGLTHVPRLGVYQGFVFACLDENVEDFDSYLDPAKPYIDAFVRASPTGRVDLSGGAMRLHYSGNWKLEGSDGYHPGFVHLSAEHAMAVVDPEKARRVSINYREDSPLQTADLGKGHTRLSEDKRLDGRDVDGRLILGLQDADDQPTQEYHRLLDEAYGPGSAHDVVDKGDPHMVIFPNLALSGGHVRLLRPLSAGSTKVTIWPALLEGVPDEINVGRLRSVEWFHGPASFGLPDDHEIFERTHAGLEAMVDPWVVLSRGTNREYVEDGVRYANVTDEVPQRGQVRHWMSLMSDGGDATAPLVVPGEGESK